MISIALEDFGEMSKKDKQAVKKVMQMTAEQKAQFLKEREEKLIKESLQTLEENKNKALWRMSIWSGKQEIIFKFSDWDIEKQANKSVAKAVAKQALSLADELKENNFNVTIFGDAGTGKTSLALAMLSRLRKAKKSAMVVSTAELSSMLAESFDEQAIKKKLTNLEKALKEVDVLLLDDFGTEGGIDCRAVRKDLQDYLYKVVNARAGVKTTIVTTNNGRDELEKMYHTKILSRLLTKDDNHKIVMKGLEDVRSV